MKSRFNVIAAISGLYLTLFTQMLDTSIAILSLVTIAIDLHLDIYRAAGIMTFYGVGIVIAFPMGAFLTRFLSEGLLFIIGSLIFIVASLGCGLASDANLFLLFRFIQGLGAGFSIVVCQALMINVLGDDKRPLAVALTMSAVTLAPVFGPLIGSLITEYLGWRWLFLSNIPLCVLGVFFIVNYLELNVKKGEKFQSESFVSLLLFAVLVSLIQFIFDFGETYSWFKAVEIKAAFTLAILVAVFFYFSNRRRNGQIFDFSLLKEPQFGISTLILTLGNGIIVSSMVLLPIWLQTDYGFSIIQAGLIVSVSSAIAALMSPLIGKYFPEKYYLSLSIFSIVMTVLSLYMMSRFSTDISREYIMMARVIAGLGIATFTAPLLTLSFKQLNVEEITQASSLSLTFRLYSANLFITCSFILWKHWQFVLYGELLSGTDRAFAVRNIEFGAMESYSFFVKNINISALNMIMQSYSLIFVLTLLPLLYLSKGTLKKWFKLSISGYR